MKLLNSKVHNIQRRKFVMLQCNIIPKAERFDIYDDVIENDSI
jgi:hypothetical protein